MPNARRTLRAPRGAARQPHRAERPRGGGAVLGRTLYQTGQIPRLEWDLQREASREAFSAGRYALADVYLVSDIDAATLRARRDADPTRTRRGFERHVLLREPLLRWYSAVRSGAKLFERLLARVD